MHTSQMDESANSSLGRSKKLPSDNELRNNQNIACIYFYRASNVQFGMIKEKIHFSLVNYNANEDRFYHLKYIQTDAILLFGRLFSVSTNQTLQQSFQFIVNHTTIIYDLYTINSIPHGDSINSMNFVL